MASVYFRDSLHVEALYLSDTFWQAQGKPGQPAPEPRADELAGIRRLRIVLPTSSAPPHDWIRIKQTTLRQLDPVFGAAIWPDLELDGFDLRVLERNSDDWQRWIDLHWQRYLETHRDNPPRSLDPDERGDVFGGEDLAVGTAVGLWENDRLVGFASLRSVSAESADIGWVGARGNEPVRACKAVTKWVIGQACRLSLQSIEIEVDDSDEQLQAILPGLPSDRDDIFVTWEKPV